MNELLISPESLRNINDEQTEGMIATFREYVCRDVADRKIIFNRVQHKRIILLKYWVKDKVQLQAEVDFETGTTQYEFIKAIEEASKCKYFCINQKNTGASLITTAFQVQLEAATQWERWPI